MVEIFTLLPSEDVSGILFGNHEQGRSFLRYLKRRRAKARYKAWYHLEFKIYFKLLHIYHLPSLLDNCIIVDYLNNSIGRSDKLVHDNVKEIATKRGLSIGKLEKMAGLSKGAISKWKTSSPTVDNLQAVAKVLKVKVDKLLE